MKVRTIFYLILFALSPQLLTAQEFVIEKLNDKINSSYDEISPVIDVEGKTLYFTRVGFPEFEKTLVENGEDLSQTLGSPNYSSYLQNIYTRIADKIVHNPEGSVFNQDIWVAESVNGDFDEILHPSYPLNNALPNSVCAITPSNNELVVINRFEKEGGMKKGFSIVRQFADGTWSFPEPIDIEEYNNTNPDVSMTISGDGSVMILAMEKEDSYGKTDLYISHKKDANTWSAPINLGPKVNSVNREVTPFISDDNKTIFFASNRLGTHGGMDLFIIDCLDENWSKWSRPRRFIHPINSTFDDSQPFFNAATGYLYFSSKRDGSSDIFRVKIAPPNPSGVVVKGHIYNSNTNRPISGKVLSGPSDQVYRNVYVSDDGSFRFVVPKGEEFLLKAVKPGYSGIEESVKFKKSYIYFKEYEVDLYLDPLEIGSKIELDPIFFAQSKPTVLSTSYPTLNILAAYLKENQNISIRIQGHTDNQGEEAPLQKLSEERANAIKEYLVYKMRIAPLRIETIGYGSTKPANDNSTDELRKQNRRVEFEIIKIYKDPALGLKNEKNEK